jgi:hypothetical protein
MMRSVLDVIVVLPGYLFDRVSASKWAAAQKIISPDLPGCAEEPGGTPRHAAQFAAVVIFKAKRSRRALCNQCL